MQFFTSAFAEVLILRVISLDRSLAHACNSKTKVAKGPNFFLSILLLIAEI